MLKMFMLDMNDVSAYLVKIKLYDVCALEYVFCMMINYEDCFNLLLCSVCRIRMQRKLAVLQCYNGFGRGGCTIWLLFCLYSHNSGVDLVIFNNIYL